MNNIIRKKDIDSIPSRLNYFKSPMFSYLSWNWINIDIIFYRVNNIVAAILSIISNNSKFTPKFNFDFFFLHRTIETIKPLCVYQFPGYLNRVETSINNMCSLYRRVYSIRELLSPSTQKSLQSRDNCPWQGSCLPSKCTDTHSMVLASWSSWILFSVFSIHSLYFSPHCLFSC